MTEPSTVFVHPSAIVDEPATVGEGTKIWHFCHIMAGAVIGSNCVLGQNVYVAGRVTIGHGCRIQNNVSLYDGVTLEDEVFLGPSCVFTNVRNPRASVKCRAFELTQVQRGATLGANCTIVAGCMIGSWSFVGAGSTVLESIPNFALVVGNPAKQIGWMSRRGERLSFDAGIARCPETGELYRMTPAGVEFAKDLSQ